MLSNIRAASCSLRGARETDMAVLYIANRPHKLNGKCTVSRTKCVEVALHGSIVTVAIHHTLPQ